jgi:hypothetical protein
LTYFEPKQNFSTNSNTVLHIELLKPPLTLPEVFNKISPVSHIPVKKPREKQQATVLTSSEFTENGQKLKDAKSEREKIKIKGNPTKSSMNKMEAKSWLKESCL